MRRLTAMLLIGLLSLPGLCAAADKESKKAGSVRVYRFDNLDIEGHLKTPHLLYFLKRIRNKFRSFRIPEPQLTRKIIESKNADFLK